MAMKSWKDLIVPRDEIIIGSINESMFTASLDNVIANREEDPTYSDGASFFDNTHITKGLSKVIIQVFSSLLGKKAGNNVIELRTTFGGGKTHALISLYHLSQNLSIFSTHKSLSEINKELEVPEELTIHLAALIGSRENVSIRRKIMIDGEETEVKTWCGELAYQLGGEEGYKIVAPNDFDKSAPGKDTIYQLLDSINEPCLILMDEAVSYLSSLGGIDKHLYNETLQFIQQLVEVVSKRDGCAFVFSLPETKIECGSEEGEEARDFMEDAAKKVNQISTEETYAKTKKVTQRVKTSVDPVEFKEIFEIIRKRLFKPISAAQFEEIREVLTEFWDVMKSWGEKFLPGDIFRTAGVDITYEQKFLKAFPFHPSLFDTFYNEWGAHAQFQRTRAMLRIFAKVVNYFWRAEENLDIIMPGDLPFDKDDSVKTELLNYMGENFESVIAQDMKRCSDLESKYSGDYSKWQVYSRLFRSIFLHSLPVGGKSQGVPEMGILLECIHINMTPASFKDAIQDLKDNLFHLFQEGSNYVVKFDINLNAMIVDECERVDQKQVEDFLWKKIETLVPKSYAACLWPEESKDIPEKPASSALPNIIFVICSTKFATTKLAIEKQCISKMQGFVTMRGSTPRVYKNSVFFVLMNRGYIEEITKNVTRYIAMDQIYGGAKPDESQFQQLNSSQLADMIRAMYELNPEESLKTRLKSVDSKMKLVVNNEKTISTLILNAYTHVAHWNGKSFDQYEIVTTKTKLVERVQDTLIEQGLIMNQMAPGYISNQIGEIISVETFWGNFFQVLGENIPASVNVMQKSLSEAIQQKKLAYCVYSEGIIDIETNKPDDFPVWGYGDTIEPKEIKIAATSWLLPAACAEKIIANGETAPANPTLNDIPELRPFENQTKITWSLSNKATYYKLFRDVSTIQDVGVLTPIYEGKQSEFTDQFETPAPYYFVVLAGNNFGESALSSSKSVEYRIDFPPLSAVLNKIQQKKKNEQAIEISWNAAKGAETYILLQSNKVITEATDGESLFEGTEINFEYTIPSIGIYYFAVIARNKFGDSSVSNCEGISFGPASPPMASKLKVKLDSALKSVEIEWTEISDAAGYRLYRDTDSIKEFTPSLIELVNDNVISFQDDPVNAGTYYYAVIAYNENGDSVFSNSESITIAGEENPIVVSLGIEVEYLTDFADNFGEITGDFIKIGADPEISIIFKARIPNNITKMAQSTLKNKLNDILNKIKGTSDVKISWDV